MKRRWSLVLLIAASVLMGGCAKKETGRTVLRFGTLPVLQSLDLFVADIDSLFEQAGVDVELIPFNTASEKDIALSAGQIDGYFGDLFTPIVLKGNGVDVRIVATNYATIDDRRMFAVVAKPRSERKTLGELVNVPVAISSNTVIDYVTESLLLDAGVPENEIGRLESKNIGIRMQMLMSGQVEAATLPEPLVTAAMDGGAVLLADDRGIPESQTVFAFTKKFCDKHPDLVKAFTEALNKSHLHIENHPENARKVMVENVRLPKQLQETFPVPEFHPLRLPTEVEISNAVSWLVERGVLTRSMGYGELVDGRFLNE